MKSTAAVTAVLAVLVLSACGAGKGETTAGPSQGTVTTTPSAGRGQTPGASKGKARDGTAETDPGGAAGSAEGSSPGPHKGVPGDTSASFTPPAHDDSPTGAAGFEVKGGDNSIQEFGGEASAADFAAAATALHGYLDARAAGAWRDACSFVSPAVIASFAQLGGGGGGCPEALAAVSSGIPSASLREAADAEVGALRAEGGRGFLLFRGAQGVDYFMPMLRDSGRWRVAAIAASPIS